MSATKTRPIKVTQLRDSGDYVVARTDDVDVAREAARQWERDNAESWEYAEWVQERVEAVDDLAPRVGWYRWTPCHESSCWDGGGHSGHLGYADGPGRGVFRGVYLQGPL
jgi:hypothetical protein